MIFTPANQSRARREYLQGKGGNQQSNIQNNLRGESHWSNQQTNGGGAPIKVTGTQSGGQEGGLEVGAAV